MSIWGGLGEAQSALGLLDLPGPFHPTMLQAQGKHQCRNIPPQEGPGLANRPEKNRSTLHAPVPLCTHQHQCQQAGERSQGREARAASSESRGCQHLCLRPGVL